MSQTKVTPAEQEIPWKRVAYVSMSGGNTTSSSFVNIPGSTVALTNLVKLRSDTNLVIRIDASFYVTGTGDRATFGVNFNGTDYEVCKRFVNELSSYKAVGGQREVTGIPAGTYTFTARVKRNTSGQINFDDAGFVALSVEEVKAS